MNSHKTEAAMLRTSGKDRLQLTDKLIDGLPLPPAVQSPDAILNEAIRRDAELENGRVRPRSETEFWNEVRRARA